MSHQTCLILMTSGFEPLGEVLSDDRMCRQINLNRQGEVLLGRHISDWQTQGLAHMQPSTFSHQGSRMDVWHAKNHTLQSKDFLSVLAAWLEDHGFNYVILPLGAMLAWSQIQHMDVVPQKKYELAIMLRDLPVHKLTS